VGALLLGGLLAGAEATAAETKQGHGWDITVEANTDFPPGVGSQGLVGLVAVHLPFEHQPDVHSYPVTQLEDVSAADCTVRVCALLPGAARTTVSAKKSQALRCIATLWICD
jgi:hypothetical protein